MDSSTLTTLICPQCQYENDPGGSRCQQCQAPLPIVETTPTHPTQDNTGPPTTSPTVTDPETIAALEEDTSVTVSPPLDAAANSTDHGLSPAAPLSISLPPSTAKIDPHRPTAARLQHDTSHHYLPLATDVFVWRIGKPHHGAQPDLDISAFPRSEIVSRSHALIRYHRGQYYIEDMNSSNGTYVNNQSLVPGRHYPLNHNDCIVLGKGDLVRFFFQICAC
jgi:FHA domain